MAMSRYLYHKSRKAGRTTYTGADKISPYAEEMTPEEVDLAGRVVIIVFSLGFLGLVLLALFG